MLSGTRTIFNRQGQIRAIICYENVLRKGGAGMRTEEWKERWHEFTEKLTHPFGARHETREETLHGEAKGEEKRSEPGEHKIDEIAGSE